VRVQVPPEEDGEVMCLHGQCVCTGDLVHTFLPLDLWQNTMVEMPPLETSLFYTLNDRWESGVLFVVDGLI
jgi:hypothetical protein